MTEFSHQLFKTKESSGSTIFQQKLAHFTSEKKFDMSLYDPA